jgi:hypothetical protein
MTLNRRRGIDHHPLLRVGVSCINGPIEYAADLLFFTATLPTPSLWTPRLWAAVGVGSSILTCSRIGDRVARLASSRDSTIFRSCFQKFNYALDEFLASSRKAEVQHRGPMKITDTPALK